MVLTWVNELFCNYFGITNSFVLLEFEQIISFTLQWRHNERDGVSNRQPHECLLNCLFRYISKRGIHRWPENSPYQGLATRKVFPSDEVIMYYRRRVENQPRDQLMRTTFCVCICLFYCWISIISFNYFGYTFHARALYPISLWTGEHV